MSELVTVFLDRRRPYRERQEDRKAIWVGPGRVQVPAWVAEAWGMQAEVAVSSEKDTAPPVQMEASADAVEATEVESPPVDVPVPVPWAGYDGQSAAEIIPRLAELSHTERAIVAAYEASHKGRKTVLDAARPDEVP